MTTVEQKRGDLLVPIAIAVVGFELFVLLLTGFVAPLFPGLFSTDAYQGNFHFAGDTPTRATPFATWDAQHYLYLAGEGYAPGRPSIAFFPLFPWLIRALAVLPGIGPLTAALLIANGLALAAVLLLVRFVDRAHPGAGVETALLLLAFPGALFFHFPYTESLFLFLSVATLIALARERWLPAAAAAFALALTRPNGVLIGVALLYAAIACWRRTRKFPWPALVALAAPALGFAVYLLFMRGATGNAFAGLEMQGAFNAGRSLGNFLQPLSVLRELIDVRAPHSVLNSLLDRLVFLFVTATLVPLWRIDRLLFWYALPMALVGPLSGSFVSYTRFAAVLFPCSLVVARVLSGDRRRPLLWLTMAVWLVIQTALLIRHVSFRWAG